MSTENKVSSVTVPHLIKQKSDEKPIVMITAYDFTFAKLVDQAGADIVLVGDTLGTVIQGQPHTLSVSLDDIIYHARCVRRAVKRAHLVGDMPFMSYQVNPEQALINAGRLVQESGVESIKLEGGEPMANTISKIVSIGIPVMGHLGLTPQSIHAFGGYRVQARDSDSASRLMRDAKALQDAGAYSIVLEGIPHEIAQKVSQSLEIPTIGIGAGPNCDGQVLVMHDILGLDAEFAPKFVKKYLNLAESVSEAFRQFSDEVRSRKFPTLAHSYGKPSK